MTTVLILPGHGNSSEGHWQSEWERVHDNCVRVVQDDWETPNCADWSARLAAVMAAHEGDIVIAAHSLGCLLTVHWAERAASHEMERIKGALLVAPPDPRGDAFPQHSTNFSATVTHPLLFPSCVVASTDDVYGSLAFAQGCANDWGSHLVDVGAHGHINADSGLGQWTAGWALLSAWR